MSHAPPRPPSAGPTAPPSPPGSPGPPGRARRVRPVVLSQPFQEFVARNVTGGRLLLLATVVALAWANSPWAHLYDRLWETHAVVALGPLSHDHTLHAWVNDALMAVFFLVVGLEIKRELLAGELRTPRRAAVPVAAALGGMLVPAGLYALLNTGGGGAAGWGVPMATDIGFALAVVTALSRWVPLSARVFLVALAIVDDLSAVVVIGIFYTDSIRWGALLVAALVLGALAVANAAGVQRPAVYAVGAVGAWLAVFDSGVHASITGALVALTVPARSGVPLPRLVEEGRQWIAHLDETVRHHGHTAREAPGRVSPILGAEEHGHLVSRLAARSRLALTPLQRIEHALSPVSSLVILPLFALANAGVRVGDASAGILSDPIAWGVVVGLVLGKPVGVVVATVLAVRLGLGALADDLTWRHVVGLGSLAGIGFTMSLFVSNLAFGSADQVTTATLAVFVASLLATALGVAVLRSPAARTRTGAAPAAREPARAA
jgi:Na+:H+ antiporter, NhaA family